VFANGHERSGHLGKNKVGKDLSRSFCWPSMYSDIAQHCRSCSVCQKYSKSKPRHTPIVEREIVTIPYERIAIDLVGPLPKARGEFEFILKCVDLATRWPEAVALKKTTARIVIRELLEMFSRNGFPGTIVSDNGLQFMGKEFDSFCRENGISHTKTSVYCPESNGVVERFHGSLKNMVAKCGETKGSWPDVLPMALFFLRMTPHTSSGFSPFMLTHGLTGPVPGLGGKEPGEHGRGRVSYPP